jgi:predicted flap endonuclease-1-like 5' DNA nuclease
MTYLITEISIALFVALLIGFFLGFLFCKIVCGKKKSNHDQVDDTDTDLDDDQDYISAEIDDENEGAVIDLDTSVDLETEGYHIQTLEGIGPSTGDLFRGYGVATVGDYLRKLHAPHQREQVSKDLNILRKPLDNWASMADFLRVDGIDHQYAELLQASGLATIKDLANSEAVHLANHMEEVNKSGKQLIAPTSPSPDQVEKWIGQARGMAQVVTF